MTIEIAPSETQGSSDIKPAAAAGEVNMEGEQAKNSYESNQQAMVGWNISGGDSSSEDGSIVEVDQQLSQESSLIHELLEDDE